MSRLSRCVWMGAWCFALVTAALTQTNTSLNTERLRDVTRAAGVIFRGTVLSVGRVRPTHARQLETVQICFLVNENVRGTKPGATFCIREWAGLWKSRDRYRVGEWLALFLYPPSRLGLSSPVGGEEGRYSIDGAGRGAGSTAGTAPPPRNRIDSSRDQAPHRTLSPGEFRQLVRNALVRNSAEK